mgnify:FL=1
MRQDVGGDTWTFSYDLNGNMTGKTNGVDTWTYTWDTLDGNRLIRVQGPGGVDVAYSYDSAGRMITRDDGSDVTNFVWDRWTIAREITGLSVTTFCSPHGFLFSFIRDGARFDAHFDALGSVRLVTDDEGDVVLRRDFDASGSELAGGFDSVPGGMPYGFIGGLGARKDLATGLVYMRSRHYDPQLARFISRDPVRLHGSLNSYVYAGNSPVTNVDPTGRKGFKILCGKAVLVSDGADNYAIDVRPENLCDCNELLRLLNKIWNEGTGDFTLDSNGILHPPKRAPISDSEKYIWDMLNNKSGNLFYSTGQDINVDHGWGTGATDFPTDQGGVYHSPHTVFGDSFSGVNDSPLMNGDSGVRPTPGEAMVHEFTEAAAEASTGVRMGSPDQTDAWRRGPHRTATQEEANYHDSRNQTQP